MKNNIIEKYLIPSQILNRDKKNLVDLWVKREHEYCKNIIKPFAVAIAVLMFIFFFLDMQRTGFDLSFSLFHRAGSAALFLATFTLIKYDTFKNKLFSFAYYKFVFLLAGFYLCSMQQVYMFNNPESPRIYAPVIMACAIFVSAVGLKTTLVYITLNITTLLIAGLVINQNGWNEVVSDTSLMIIGSFVSFAFTKIYSLQVMLFIATSEEKNEAFAREKHAFKELTKIVYPHMVNRIKDGFQLEETMPLGSGKAYAITFDICGSSKVSHELFDTITGTVFQKCNDIMLEGYDQESLVSNAYKVKDMGDGFLCTVGFPFATPNGHRGAEVALNIAVRFIETFQREIEKMEYPDPIYCSVAICWDGIEGYFPISGVKQYDVRGRAIVLATRYETLRKRLYSSYSEYPGHILTVSEQVIKNLPKARREEFKKIELKDIDIKIRDDESATCFYQMTFPVNEKIIDLKNIILIDNNIQKTG